MYANQQRLARMAGTVKGSINTAIGKAGAAFAGVKGYLPAAGTAVAVLGAGMEAKNRLDRGEDGQRAATGAIAGLGGTLAGAAKGAAIGTPFGGVPGAVIGGLVGGALGAFGAGYATDRITDAVRGNDGKGTDAVLRDLDGQIQQAQARGDFSRAAQLMQEASSFQKSRMPAGSQSANANELARQYGVQSSDAIEFGNLNSAQKMEKYLAEMQFASALDQDRRSYNQRFAQQKERDIWNQALTDKERRRNQAVMQQNEAVKTQQGIIGSTPDRIQRSFGDYAQAAAATQLGGIR
jgi:hypothetical protein